MTKLQAKGLLVTVKIYYLAYIALFVVCCSLGMAIQFYTTKLRFSAKEDNENEENFNTKKEQEVSQLRVGLR